MATAVTRIEKENIVLQIGDCTVTILPQFGGKVASILVKGHELLQTPLVPYGPRTKTMGFNEGDASGWDECLPSVSGCTVQTVNGPAEIPDHGDLWRVEWKVVSSGSGSVTLSGDCFSLPLTLVRTTTLTQSEKGYRLHADYKLTNTSDQETPWAWSAHPGYAAEEGDLLSLPDSIQALRIEWTRNDRLMKSNLDKSNGMAAWPIAKLTAGGETDLRVSAATHSGVGDKLFAGPLTAHENWVSLTRPKAGVRLRVSFDAAKTPYLGLWICQDGYPEGSIPQQHCVAMEPTTAPVDTLAITGPWSRTLKPHESNFWPMTLDLEVL